MRRLIATVISFVVLVFLLSACAQDPVPSNPENPASDPSAATSSQPTVAQYDQYNMPLTLTCTVSGEFDIDEYDTLQYWNIVYFEGGKFSHSDIYILFATKDEAAKYASEKNAEMCDNGYIVKRTSDDGWRNYTREKVVSNITNWPMAVIDMQDGEINPCDNFNEIKSEYNLP